MIDDILPHPHEWARRLAGQLPARRGDALLVLELMAEHVEFSHALARRWAEHLPEEDACARYGR